MSYTFLTHHNVDLAIITEAITNPFEEWMSFLDIFLGLWNIIHLMPVFIREVSVDVYTSGNVLRKDLDPCIVSNQADTWRPK